MYNHDLDKDLASEEKGPLGRIFRSIAGAGRAENRAADHSLAQKEAQELYDVTNAKTKQKCFSQKLSFLYICYYLMKILGW